MNKINKATFYFFVARGGCYEKINFTLNPTLAEKFPKPVKIEGLNKIQSLVA